MDLLKLNNEISGMRPSARQSTVRVIHFLTRKADKFRQRNGPEDKKATYEKKAEKLMQEALIDKVLVPDEIVKFALQFDSSLRDKVLNDISIPLSAKAFARIAAHPFMVGKVNEFREKYPDWNKWLEKSLEKLGTGSRFGAKMKNGRVKAHLQQRQRVEEAIDTIRRAQMAWLHHSGKNEIQVELEEKTKKTGGEVSLGENVKADEEESSDLEYKKVIPKAEGKQNSEFRDSSDTEIIENASPKATLSKKSKDSKKSVKDDKESLKCSIKKKTLQTSKTVVYEEIDENESGNDEIIDNNYTGEQNARTDKRKNKSVIDKKVSNKKLVRSEKRNDMSSELAGDSENEQESSTANESENSGDDEELEDTEDDESESPNELENNDEIDEKTKKKLLKKEKRKKNVIIPRSREVEVCKFSELLTKEQKRKSDEDDDPSDSDNDLKSSKSPEKGVDPFFMTKNNDFLRIATAKREAKQEEPVRTGPKWGIEGSENWTGTRRERRARARRMMGVPDPEGYSGRRGPPKFNSPSFAARRENSRDGHSLPLVKNLPAVPDVPEELHPSWAAKRKLNIASVGFQGKKVKFDDSD